jgi:putative flippase GtrA
MVKFAEKVWKFWASRTLMIGAVSTALDLSTGGLVLWLGGTTRMAAMAGTTVGSTFSYFANRHFAFKDHEEPVAKSGLKYFVMQAVLGTLHGQAVVLLRDTFGLNYVVAKMSADMMVITGPQMFLMRYFIFPKRPLAPAKLDSR